MLYICIFSNKFDLNQAIRVSHNGLCCFDFVSDIPLTSSYFAIEISMEQKVSPIPGSGNVEEKKFSNTDLQSVNLSERPNPTKSGTMTRNPEETSSGISLWKE
jgi:hypothetical protein